MFVLDYDLICFGSLIDKCIGYLIRHMILALKMHPIDIFLSESNIFSLELQNKVLRR